MRLPVLKAIANPTRIFYVPYHLALMNFFIQFIVFIVLLIVTVGNFNPLWFLLNVIFVHFILMGISRSEPQMGQILSAKLKLFKVSPPKVLRP